MGKLKLFTSNIFKIGIDLMAALAFLALSSILVSFSYFLLSLIFHITWLSGYIYVFTGTFIVWGYILGHYYSSNKTLILGCLISIFCWLMTYGSMCYFPAILGCPLIGIGLFLRKKTAPSNTTKLEESSLLVQLAIISFLCLIIFTSTMSKRPDSYSQNPAITKEAASMISASYTVLRTEKKTASTTAAKDLLQYMNFVVIDTDSNYGAKRPITSTTINEEGWWPPLLHWLQQWDSKSNKQNPAIKGTPLQPCSQRLQCFKLHNGGILQFDTQQTFGGTASTNAIFFNLDPDGYGPEERVSLYQYFNGELTTGGTKRPNTQTSATTLTSQDKDPKYAPVFGRHNKNRLKNLGRAN